jgi:hypothetical protein
MEVISEQVAVVGGVFACVTIPPALMGMNTSLLLLCEAISFVTPLCVAGSIGVLIGIGCEVVVNVARKNYDGFGRPFSLLVSMLALAAIYNEFKFDINAVVDLSSLQLFGMAGAAIIGSYLPIFCGENVNASLQK